jgi:prevent-host-death family protein
MKTVTIQAAKTDLADLVDDVAAGEEVMIAKDGKPVARLVPLDVPRAAPRGKRVLGTLAGQGRIPDDFDKPLPDEVLKQFLGG